MSKPSYPREQAWAIDGQTLTAICRTVSAMPLASFSSLVPPGKPEPYEVINGAAVIKIHGPLEKNVSLVGWLFDSTAMTDIREQLRQAVDDPSVTRIVLHIDSPGGTVSGTDDLAQDVRAATSVKPVVAFVEDMGCSAAYWIASQANEVYATRSSVVGSVGTFAVVQDWSASFEAMGVHTYVVRTGRFKGIGAPGATINDEELAHLQEGIDAVNQVFLDAVQSARGLSSKEMAIIRQAGTFVGRAALDVGLIDGIRSFESVLKSTGAAVHSPVLSGAKARMTSGSRRFGERDMTPVQRQWANVVSSHRARGLSRVEAVKAANRSHPKLREKLVNEAASSRRR